MPLTRGPGVWLLTALLMPGVAVSAADLRTPEQMLRALAQANADKDLATMARFMAQDEDAVSYSIGGRKYRRWSEFAHDMEEEFKSVARLEIPITDLKIWTRGDTAWFAMELDYIRYVLAGKELRRTVLPLRETGVLERRNGEWILVAWHESLRNSPFAMPVAEQDGSASRPKAEGTEPPATILNVSGEWEIQEEDKSYKAILDRSGNGTYTWQNGRITTTGIAGRRWQGTWQQTGNDREGGFEVLLSEDGNEAKGVWWYTRVGDRVNIPPRQWGGGYIWKHLTAPPQPTAER